MASVRRRNESNEGRRQTSSCRCLPAAEQSVGNNKSSAVCLPLTWSRRRRQNWRFGGVPRIACAHWYARLGVGSVVATRGAPIQPDPVWRAHRLQTGSHCQGNGRQTGGWRTRPAAEQHQLWRSAVRVTRGERVIGTCGRYIAHARTRQPPERLRIQLERVVEKLAAGATASAAEEQRAHAHRGHRVARAL